MRAKVLHNPFVQYSRGLNWYSNIDELAALARGRGSTETPSKLFANHNALGQLTNHNTFRFSEGGPSSNPELIEPFVPGWGERYCNNLNYVRNNAIFEPPSMRACSSTPPKQNQDFIKEHNRTPLSKNVLLVGFYLHTWGQSRFSFISLSAHWFVPLYAVISPNANLP